MRSSQYDSPSLASKSSSKNSSNADGMDDAHELVPADIVYVNSGVVASKYDEPLFDEVEELLGASSAPRPCTLVWRDLTVHVKLKDGKLKRLVNNVSGIAKPGSLVALMGPSGAGKTTLMSALAHRSPSGTIIDGEIAMNGVPVGEFMHLESGYMHQDELFVENLTVMEHLTIMARLRMDRRTSPLARRRKVNQLMRQLSLYGARHTRIGGLDGQKTLSGGERKRLAFASELLIDPGLLFCDEPTTGLDSSSAQKLMTLLRASAVQGKTVICTIHQPSSELMALFDKLVLLAEGRVGFAGNASGALNFFESLGYQCPITYNPTDYFIKVLALTPGSEGASRQAIKSVCDRFAVSDAAKELDMEIHLEFHLMDNEDEDSRRVKHNYKPPFLHTKIIWLVYRYLLIILRDPRVQFVRILQKLAIALTAGLCFIGTARLTQAGVQDVQGALFIIIAENTFSPMYSVLHMFPEEFPLLHRELKAGLYSTPVYYVARMLAQFPGLVVEPTLFTLVVYWVAGLRGTFYAFGFTIFLSILVLNVAIACGSFFSCAFGSMPIAIAYLVPFDYSLMMTSGLFVKLSSIPKYISWIRHLSWLMYSNEAMSILQWDGVENITCTVPQIGVPCVSTGEEVLQKYDFEANQFWIDILALFLLYLAFHLLALFALRYRTRRK
ncbi:protein scarlet-like [Bicyclus anynana]|uniref:Protein scarlet-like n=1 Tax=Bicyclus anynana TaxID=110368 RepID=A0ABM3LEL4_BICAN|nr:protein scarlet-like [Bicyclus anynana]XP_052737502.1 protein scarlet-like [Bicyclus anynana]